MRFDDRLATVLALPVADSGSRVAAWMQLVDLLAQDGDGTVSAPVELAYDLLRQWRDAVPRERRRGVAAALRGRAIDPRIVAFFAEDEAGIAAPVIVGAILPSEAWLELIPALSPSARALLRHRRDVGADVERALASFGPADLVLSTSVVAEPAPEVKPAMPTSATHVPEIAELVARIEAFRRQRAARKPAMPGDAAPDLPQPRATVASVSEFSFETDADGMIQWSEGAPREEVIGVSIAVAAQSDHGVDGHAAGAFRRRAPFRDARLTLAHDGATGGEWQISGVPFFEGVSGRFRGFRGAARRPRPDERAAPIANGLYGSGLPADSLRQLVHELRTPLNAIIGFAEMIDQQMLGPAAADYRGRAGAILDDARRLLGTVDDLDVAARIDSGADLAAGRGDVADAAAALRACAAESGALATLRRIALDLRIDPATPAAGVDALSLDRMFSRLLSAVIGLAASGEAIVADLAPGGNAIRFSVSRTRAMLGRDEQALLDPGYSPDGDWPDAPALGLGFALRLVRNLAEAAGGRLMVEPERFVLILPGAADSPVEREGQR